MLWYVELSVSQLGACSCEVVFGFVGQLATILRSVKELTVNVWNDGLVVNP